MEEEIVGVHAEASKENAHSAVQKVIVVEKKWPGMAVQVRLAEQIVMYVHLNPEVYLFFFIPHAFLFSNKISRGRAYSCDFLLRKKLRHMVPSFLLTFWLTKVNKNYQDISTHKTTILYL